MKICLYSPYVPKHFGGGEKYLLDCAVSLSRQHEVTVAMSSVQAVAVEDIRKRYETFFGLDLSRVQFIESPLGTSASFFKKIWWTKQWDVIYYLTDGSLFFSLAKKNILHLQFPFTFAKQSPLERLKLWNWKVKNTNSQFTKKVIEKSWQTKIDLVHWPMIEVKKKLPATKKEKIILNVGRFFKQLHSKRQDVLVGIFKELWLHHEKLKPWKLVLIGGVEDQSYFQKVKHLAQGLPVEFYTDLDRMQLEKWYERASIYWHATGYGLDETKAPEKVEHFGISTVEAMSFGCVPVVIGKGGQNEIMTGELTRLLWQTKAECLEKTMRIMTNEHSRLKYSQLALERSKVFGQERFDEQLKQMI